MKIEITNEQIKEALSNMSEEERDGVLNEFKSKDIEKDIKPKVGDTTYWIDIDGQIHGDNTYEEDSCYNVFNEFKTKEQAEYEVEFRKFKRRFIDWKKANDNIKLNWGDEEKRYHFYYDHDDNMIYNTYDIGIQKMESWKYLSSYDICKDAIEYFGEKDIKKYYIGINQPY